MSKTSSSTPSTADEIARLTTVDGYFERFYDICGEYSTYFQAYAAMEDEYYRLFGRYRYSSYPSFLVMKHRYLQKLRLKSAQSRRNRK